MLFLKVARSTYNIFSSINICITLFFSEAYVKTRTSLLKKVLVLIVMSSLLFDEAAASPGGEGLTILESTILGDLWCTTLQRVNIYQRHTRLVQVLRSAVQRCWIFIAFLFRSQHNEEFKASKQQIKQRPIRVFLS